jgi:hypothetical protein
MSLVLRNYRTRDFLLKKTHIYFKFYIITLLIKYFFYIFLIAIFINLLKLKKLNLFLDFIIILIKLNN